ncbi:HAD family hydrolase [Simiduia litorea]|uniref:HAD family hydrolase n=1 Tax=Simiduia litorea TaxID=1435348 RepID=UPI0036F44B24
MKFYAYNIRFLCLIIVSFLALIACQDRHTIENDLPSWNNNENSQRLFQFISDVSSKNNKLYVAPKDRIAVFDNDGTLWSEQPAYFQLFFAMDRVRALAETSPELKAKWLEQQPYKAVLENDMKALAASGEKGLIELVMASHTGNDSATSDEYADIVTQWVKTAKHPSTGKAYTHMVFQPMLELLTLLREKDFKVYIVSGGGVDFIRPWAEQVYGVEPENVIGSSVKLEYEYRNGNPVILRRPKLNFINDKAGKPIAIHQHIGKRPILAFGNSDGDLQMLQWTDANKLPHLSAYIHHTDAEREWAYDQDSHIGQLKQGLAQAAKQNWLVVDMKKDWRNIYPDGQSQ